MKRGKQALIIGNDFATAHTLQKMFSEEGEFEAVNTSCHGQDTLMYFQERIKNRESLPELILLDIDTTLFNGWDYLKELTVYLESIQQEPTIWLLSRDNSLNAFF